MKTPHTPVTSTRRNSLWLMDPGSPCRVEDSSGFTHDATYRGISVLLGRHVVDILSRDSTSDPSEAVGDSPPFSYRYHTDAQHISGAPSAPQILDGK